MARSAVTTGQLGKIGVDVGVQGIPEINRAIQAKLDQMVGQQAKRIWMRAALSIVREIRDNIHSISGRLAGAVYAAYGKPVNPFVLVGVSTGGRGRAPYGWVVEHGHVIWRGGMRKQGRGHQLGVAPPEPYFKPGVLAGRPIAGAIIIEGMRDLARKQV